MHSILYEYDEKVQRKKERQEGREEGLKEGEPERKALAEENARLREEIERLRASL